MKMPFLLHKSHRFSCASSNIHHIVVSLGPGVMLTFKDESSQQFKDPGLGEGSFFGRFCDLSSLYNAVVPLHLLKLLLPLSELCRTTDLNLSLQTGCTSSPDPELPNYRKKSEKY